MNKNFQMLTFQINKCSINTLFFFEIIIFVINQTLTHLFFFA